MNIFLLFTIPLAIVSIIMLPLLNAYHKQKTGSSAKNVKKSVVLNLCAFFGVCLAAFIAPVGQLVMAATADAAVISLGQGLGYIAAALSTGLGCVGTGVAVSAAAPAAIGACSEDPKAFGKAIVFVGMGEGIAIYGLLISFMIINSL